MTRIHVLASMNMDLTARVAHHPESGETLLADDVLAVPGGKGLNQAVAARRAGAQVIASGCLGEDSFGDQVLDFLHQEGITTQIARRGQRTGLAMITVDSQGENRIVVIPGANWLNTPKEAAHIPMAAGDFCAGVLEVPMAAVTAAFQTCHEHKGTTLLNAAPAQDLTPELRRQTDILLVNRLEFTHLTAQPLPTGAQARIARLKESAQAAGHQAIVVTLGAEGVIAHTPQGGFSLPSFACPVVDTTGAGDCFAGNLLAALGAGKTWEEALITASAAAALCVGTLGAAKAMPHAREVIRLRAAQADH